MSTEGHSGGREDDQVLVAEYALGLLEGGERAALARRIAAEPALASDLRLWRSRLSTLDSEFAPETAPAQTWGRIERRLFGESRPAEKVGWWSSLPVLRGMVVAGHLLAAVAVGYILVQPPRLDPKLFANQLVAALSEQGSSVSFVALYNPTTGSVRLTALSGAAVPEKDYELWAIQGSNAPISMGVIPIDQRSDVKTPTLPEAFGEGTVLAITLEQKGGSPTGAPQGPIVAKGAATAI
jgi:anti-sigma-K factor RskA